MDMQIWWIWMALAALFVIIEIFTAGFFIMWFGVGAAIAGIFSLVGLGMVWQWLAFVGVSTVLIIISRRFAERFSQQQPPGIGADRFIGQQGIVIEQIDEISATGRVRLGREEWRASSNDNEKIAAGEKIIVTKVDGTHLVVEKVQKGE